MATLHMERIECGILYQTRSDKWFVHIFTDTRQEAHKGPYRTREQAMHDAKKESQ